MQKSREFLDLRSRTLIFVLEAHQDQDFVLGDNTTGYYISWLENATSVVTVGSCGSCFACGLQPLQHSEAQTQTNILAIQHEQDPTKTVTKGQSNLAKAAPNDPAK